jgi:cyclin E
MRCKLIGWLLELSLHFRLHRETFYLAVNYFDRYLTGISGCRPDDLQLIALAALFISAKLEVCSRSPMWPPLLSNSN